MPDRQPDVLVLARDPAIRADLDARLRQAGLAAQHGGIEEAAASACPVVLGATADSCAEIRALRRRGLRNPVLIIGDGVDGARLLNAGADAILPSCSTGRELAAMVRALARRCPVAGADETPGEFQPLVALQQLRLTPTEQRILEMLARRPGRIVTRDLIVDTLYAGADAPRSSTVDVFVHGLRRKLDSGTGLKIETVRGAGFRLAMA